MFSLGATYQVAMPLLILCCPLDPDGVTSVRVSVVTIVASETDTKIDERLTCIARELQKMNPKLTGFRISTIDCRSVSVGRRDRFDLVEDQGVQVTVERGSDKNNLIQMKVAPPLGGEVTYETVCGKYLAIITRHRTKKDEVLILAVRVTPCLGK